MANIKEKTGLSHIWNFLGQNLWNTSSCQAIIFDSTSYLRIISHINIIQTCAYLLMCKLAVSLGACGFWLMRRSKNNLPRCHQPISDEWDDGSKDGRAVSGAIYEFGLKHWERCTRIQMTVTHIISANLEEVLTSILYTMKAMLIASLSFNSIVWCLRQPCLCFA